MSMTETMRWGYPYGPKPRAGTPVASSNKQQPGPVFKRDKIVLVFFWFGVRRGRTFLTICPSLKCQE